MVEPTCVLVKKYTQTFILKDVKFHHYSFHQCHQAYSRLNISWLDLSTNPGYNISFGNPRTQEKGGKNWPPTQVVCRLLSLSLSSLSLSLSLFLSLSLSFFLSLPFSLSLPLSPSLSVFSHACRVWHTLMLSIGIRSTILEASFAPPIEGNRGEDRRRVICHHFPKLAQECCLQFLAGFLCPKCAALKRAGQNRLERKDIQLLSTYSNILYCHVHKLDAYI